MSSWCSGETETGGSLGLASLAFLLTSRQLVKDPFQKTKVEAGGMVQQIKISVAKPESSLSSNSRIRMIEGKNRFLSVDL